MKTLFLLSAIIFSPTAKAEGDLFPEIPAVPGRVKQEYRTAEYAFERGVMDPSKVLAALTPARYSCAYYRGDYSRKDDVALSVSRGVVGRDSRALTILGTKITLQRPKGNRDSRGNLFFDKGPWADLELADIRSGKRLNLRIEVRLSTGELEGSLIVKVVSNENFFDREFSDPQYIICNLN